MHPILLDFGTIEIGGAGIRLAVPSYGALALLAVLVAWRVSRALGRQVAPHAPWTHLFFRTLLAGFVGAKLAVLLVFLPDLLAGRRPLLGLLSASGIWLGGLLLAIPVFVVMARRHRLEPAVAFGVAFVAIPLAHVPGRIGCFLAGCCYGSPTAVPWAVTYRDPIAHRINSTPLGVPVHPVQLYESALELLNFFVCYRLWRRKVPPWTIVACWFLLYGSERFVLEFLRGDARGGWGPLSTSQWIAAAMVVAALTMLGRLRWRHRAEGPSAGLLDDSSAAGQRQPTR